MKNIGVVKEYNGFYGNIIDLEGKQYILMDKNIMENNEINKYDTVLFVPEEYKKNDIARFVKKIEKENIIRTK